MKKAMKTIDLPNILRWVALLLFIAAIVRTVYFAMAPALEYDFTIKPRAWYQIRFYLSQMTNSLFQLFLLLGVAELIALKKEKQL